MNEKYLKLIPASQKQDNKNSKLYDLTQKVIGFINPNNTNLGKLTKIASNDLEGKLQIPTIESKIQNSDDIEKSENKINKYISRSLFERKKKIISAQYDGWIGTGCATLSYLVGSFLYVHNVDVDLNSENLTSILLLGANLFVASNYLSKFSSLIYQTRKQLINTKGSKEEAKEFVSQVDPDYVALTDLYKLE